ncbi:MAG: carboxymuconolactone decarboxylase family protein [Sedimentisphaerales bacterium]
MSETKEFYEKLGEKIEKMKKAAPAMSAGFGGLFSKVMTDGALGFKEKELIALGIAVAVKCKECIMAHTKKCLDSGASKEQIIEAASVAVVMGGGPAYMHVPEVIEALEALGK